MRRSGLANDTPRSTLGAISAATAAALLVAIPEAIAKDLIADHSVLQLLWARYAFQLAAMLPVAVCHRWPWRARGTQMTLQSIRVALQIGCVASFLLALRYLPLGSATALLFVAPVLIAVLAAPLLAERPKGHGWLAILLGLTGVLILVSPQAAQNKWAFLLPLGAALMLALHQIVTRRLSCHVGSVATLAWNSLLGTAATSLLLPFVWVDPGFAGWIGMASVGLIHGACQYLWLCALRTLPAHILAPFMYLEIPAALVLGFLVFDEHPAAATIIGSLVIIGSGIYTGLNAYDPDVRRLRRANAVSRRQPPSAADGSSDAG